MFNKVEVWSDLIFSISCGDFRNLCDREQVLHCCWMLILRTLVTVYWISLSNLTYLICGWFKAQQILKLLFREKAWLINPQAFKPWLLQYYSRILYRYAAHIHVYKGTCTQAANVRWFRPQYQKDLVDLTNSFSGGIKDSKKVFWIPFYLTRWM